MELAIARLLADPGQAAAVVTTADRFAAPGFDRWAGDYGVGYGDGATAIVLRRAGDAGPTDLLLHAISSAAAPELEGMHRGDDEFSPAPRWSGPTVDMRRTKKAFLARNGMEAFAKAGQSKIHTVVSRCLADAGLDPHDPRLRCVALPRLGTKILAEAYRPALAEVTPAEIVDLGGRTGHLGAGDAAANLAALATTLRAGEFAMVLNAGAGFTWSCLLVSRAG